MFKLSNLAWRSEGIIDRIKTLVTWIINLVLAEWISYTLATFKFLHHGEALIRKCCVLL